MSVIIGNECISPQLSSKQLWCPDDKRLSWWIKTFYIHWQASDGPLCGLPLWICLLPTMIRGKRFTSSPSSLLLEQIVPPWRVLRRQRRSHRSHWRQGDTSSMGRDISTYVLVKKSNSHGPGCGAFWRAYHPPRAVIYSTRGQYSRLYSSMNPGRNCRLGDTESYPIRLSGISELVVGSWSWMWVMNDTQSANTLLNKIAVAL